MAKKITANRIRNLVREVQEDHEKRLTSCHDIPLRRRGRRLKARPQTALIIDKLRERGDL